MKKQMTVALLVSALHFAGSTRATAAFVPAPLPAAPNTARATYDPHSGEFWFSVGSNLNILGAEAPGLLNTGQLPKLGNKAADMLSKNVLAYFDFSSELPVGTWSQGLLLPPGLDVSPEGIATQISVGYQSGGMDFLIPVDVRVPESATLALSGIAVVIGSLIRHRRGG